MHHFRATWRSKRPLQGTSELGAKKVQALLPYRVDSSLMKETGNSNCKFLHCLPAFHDRETPTGAKFFEEFGLEGIEVSHDVFESEASVVFQQSENRLHTIKAIMVATL